MGNFKDSKLEALAKKGNGNYAYLDDIREAEKVLVKEMTQTFYSVADNVFLNVQFNPEVVKEYRLIGFDNRKDAIADSSGELDGGDIGSGNSVLAIFELTPVVSDSLLKNSPQSPSVAKVSLSYNLPDDKGSQLLNYNCPGNYLGFKNIDKELQLGASIVMFGLKLRMSKYLGNVDWPEIEAIATSSFNPKDYLQKEFVQLVVSAKKQYKKGKKRSNE
jgi:Ca-activated chloride channel family protein